MPLAEPKIRDEAQGQQDVGDPKREIDEEDPAPVQVSQDHATESGDR